MQSNHPIPPQIFALKRLIAFISHDLRQPLTAILANAEFLIRPDIGRTQRAGVYREIRSDVDRINNMVAALLEGSKGRDTLQPAVRNIVHTVESAIRTAGVRQEFRRITITYHHVGRAKGWFDADRLERVLVNLVLNACEAVDPASGQIVITTTGNRDSLHMTVWDNGPGIPMPIQNSAFQPFVSYGKPGGNGLGLAIAKKIVEDHGGSIGLEERTETGTLFKITIPFAIPRAHGAL
jgi:signal transduction histidine kinase